MVEVVLGVVAVGGIALASWVRMREQRAEIPEGRLTDFSTGEVAGFLYAEYVKGRIHHRALEAARQCAPPWFDPLSSALNHFICVEVAAGRYHEALQWRSRWSARPGRDADDLLRINEAEALACLGRFDESLERVERVPNAGWLRLARSAHRAWVFAEMGRVTEAQAELVHLDERAPFPHDFVAELWFSRFAVALAGRQLAAAKAALDGASKHVVRESSRRNLDFYRAQLALAQGLREQALEHFARGGQSVYRAQGGAALLAWGDTLRELGREQEAREKWQRCVEEDPQAPAAELARRLLAPPTV